MHFRFLLENILPPLLSQALFPLFPHGQNLETLGPSPRHGQGKGRCRTDRIGLAAQDWLVPAPAKSVVTSADGESKEGREEGRRTSEHLQEEEMRLLMKNEERRDRPIVTDHTHLPDHLPDQLPDQLHVPDHHLDVHTELKDYQASH